jgi:altronate dehydratase large subunit
MGCDRTTFAGYRRPDGRVGTRNYVGVLSTVTCANQAAVQIAGSIDGAAVFTHQQGCGVTRADLEMTQRTLINLGRNPNLGAVLVVSLGCEGQNAEAIAHEIASSGKPVELVGIQAEGGFFAAINAGGRKAQQLSRQISDIRREEVSIADLRLGIKCGASDPTSGLAANPAIGVAVDLLLDAGGSAVFGETTELVGAEHILSRRCVDESVAERLLSMVAALEQRIRQSGSDIRGGNPSAGNIAAGLTTLEEKSLGAVVKAGTKEIRGVFDYGDCPPSGPGLYFVDSPGREPEILAALAAAGCQVIVFSTGIGAPQGFPFVPVLKISGNRKTVATLADFIDLDVSEVLTGGRDLPAAGQALLYETLRVGSGFRTRAESIGYFGSTALYQIGPTV